MSTTTTTTTVRSLCPSWCTFAGEHGFEELTDGSGFVRSHETTLATAGGSTLFLTSDDRLDAAGLTLTHSAPYVTLSGPENSELTAEGARALAAALVAAADRLDAVTVPGRALAEQVLQAIDDRGLSVADVAASAGLPVAEVERVLHREPGRLTVPEALAIADALGMPLFTLVERAQQALTADPRPVVEGGQVVETWRCQQPDAAEVFLRQVFDIDGEDATILAEEPIRNGSGSTIGTRFTITTDAAEAIRAALAAPGQVENVGQVRNVGRVETIGQHVSTGPQTEAPGQMAR